MNQKKLLSIKDDNSGLSKGELMQIAHAAELRYSKNEYVIQGKTHKQSKSGKMEFTAKSRLAFDGG